MREEILYRAYQRPPPLPPEKGNIEDVTESMGQLILATASRIASPAHSERDEADLDVLVALRDEHDNFQQGIFMRNGQVLTADELDKIKDGQGILVNDKLIKPTPVTRSSGTSPLSSTGSLTGEVSWGGEDVSFQPLRILPPRVMQLQRDSNTAESTAARRVVTIRPVPLRMNDLQHARQYERQASAARSRSQSRDRSGSESD